MAASEVMNVAAGSFDDSMSLSFMPRLPLQTAVLFLVFNRPDTTKEVFEAIRLAKPPRLYVAADGPREGREVDVETVAQVRAIATSVDWPCEVKTLFREKNLGCKYAVSSAINWFFEHEEQGIILEDDCLPSQSFFWYCEDLLLKYKDDLRIWHISGASTLKQEIVINKDSYYFSTFNHIWGWATWGNRWKFYDLSIPLLPMFKEIGAIFHFALRKELMSFWLDNFDKVSQGLIDTWDYQWYFAVWSNHGLSAIPTVNLVSNIGFGPNATHTSSSESTLANIPRSEINSSLKHPKLVVPNKFYDDFNAKTLFNLGFRSFLLSRFKTVFSSAIRRIRK